MCAPAGRSLVQEQWVMDLRIWRREEPNIVLKSFKCHFLLGETKAHTTKCQAADRFPSFSPLDGSQNWPTLGRWLWLISNKAILVIYTTVPRPAASLLFPSSRKPQLIRKVPSALTGWHLTCDKRQLKLNPRINKSVPGKLIKLQVCAGMNERGPVPDNLLFPSECFSLCVFAAWCWLVSWLLGHGWMSTRYFYSWPLCGESHENWQPELWKYSTNIVLSSEFRGADCCDISALRIQFISSSLDGDF